MFTDMYRPGLRPLATRLACLRHRRFDAPLQLLADRRRGWTRAVLVPVLSLTCFGLSSCSYVDRARRLSDVAVEVTQQAVVQTVIEAAVERQRLRRLRCLDPLLTPGTVSSAAMDPRLGQPWVDELLRDCPAFSAFIADVALTRMRSAGLGSGVAGSTIHQ